MTCFCKSIMDHVGHTVVGARPMVGARHAVPLQNTKTSSNNHAVPLQNAETMPNRHAAPEHNTQIRPATGAHGLAPQPTDSHKEAIHE